MPLEVINHRSNFLRYSFFISQESSMILAYEFEAYSFAFMILSHETTENELSS